MPQLSRGDAAVSDGLWSGVVGDENGTVFDSCEILLFFRLLVYGTATFLSSKGGGTYAGQENREEDRHEEKEEEIAGNERGGVVAPPLISPPWSSPGEKKQPPDFGHETRLTLV